MKVILLKDVPKLGRKYDVKDVSDGHGRNFLIKNGLAELATAKSLKMAEDMKSRAVAERKMDDDKIEALMAKLSNAKLVLKGKANDEGHLFAGIKTEELAHAIKEQIGVDVPSEYINLDKPVKNLGEHAIKVAMSGRKANITLSVERE